MERYRFYSVVVCLSGLTTLLACGTPTMPPPADVLAVSDELKVEGRSSWSGALADESFQLGAYSVADVDRDWTSRDNWKVAGFSSDNAAGGYGFALQHSGDAAVPGTCATEDTDDSFDLGSGFSVGGQTAKVACTCGEAASVVLQSTTTKEYGGVLKTSAGSYAIKAIYEREGALSDGKPSGYRVDGEAPVGAVEVLKPGRAWIAKSVSESERVELACIFAGLMLYMPPTDR